jgi:hypothetical protein
VKKLFTGITTTQTKTANAILINVKRVFKTDEQEERKKYLRCLKPIKTTKK